MYFEIRSFIAQVGYSLVAEDDLELPTLLPPPPKFWAYRHVRNTTLDF